MCLCVSGRGFQIWFLFQSPSGNFRRVLCSLYQGGKKKKKKKNLTKPGIKNVIHYTWKMKIRVFCLYVFSPMKKRKVRGKPSLFSYT